MTALVSCCLSAAGLRFLGHPVPPGDSAPLTIGLPHRQQAARTRAGFPCSARVRPGWLRVPSVPRGRRCPHDRSYSRPPPAASQRPVPAAPVLQPAPGRIIDEASARVHCHSPHTSLPLACDPRTERGSSGFSLSSAPSRAGPGNARQGGDRPRTLPGLRPWHQPASFDVLTHNVRPHVANEWLICVQGRDSVLGRVPPRWLIPEIVLVGGC